MNNKLATIIISEYHEALQSGLKSEKKTKMYFLSTISRMYYICLIDASTYNYIKSAIKFSQLNREENK